MLPTLWSTRSSSPTAFCACAFDKRAQLGADQASVDPAVVAAIGAGNDVLTADDRGGALRRRPSGLVEHACGRQRVPISGYRMRLLRRGRWSIQFAVALLNPSGAKMPLHSDADMVRPIVGARQVKLLSGPTGSQCQDALA